MINKTLVLTNIVFGDSVSRHNSYVFAGGYTQEIYDSMMTKINVDVEKAQADEKNGPLEPAIWFYMYVKELDENYSTVNTTCEYGYFDSFKGIQV